MGGTVRCKRAATYVAIAALVGGALPLAGFAPGVVEAAPGGITAVSVSPILSGRGVEPEVSGDGRFIAFADLVVGGGALVGEPSVPGAVQLLLNGQGVVADNNFNGPRGLSSDGRHVVFVGEAQNLTPTDNTRRYRVYTLDRDTDADGVFDEPGSTTLRRIPGRVAAGAPSPSGFAVADISSTGRFVAFTQPDVDGATACLRVYRYDRDTDVDGVFDEPGATATVDAAVSTAGVPGSRTGGCAQGIVAMQESVAISADGQHIAFTSDFDNLVAADTNNAADVFVRDFSTSTTIRIPVTADGSQTQIAGSLGDVSASGRFVAVVSTSPILAIRRVDRDADADGVFDEPDGTAIVTVHEGTSSISLPSMSSDGGTVAMWTSTGVRVWRPSTGAIVVLPVTAPSIGEVELNASGNVMALSTRDVYDATDVNGQEDVYRVELSAGPPVSMSVALSAPSTTPPAAGDIPIGNISPQTIRNANFEVSAAPGGVVRRAPGGVVRRAPGGVVRRAPGGVVRRAPGGVVRRADELSRFAGAISRTPSINNLPLSEIPIDGGWDERLPASFDGRPLQSVTFGQAIAAVGAANLQLDQLDLEDTPLANLSLAAFALGNTPLNSLLLDSSTAWCTRLQQLTGKTCFGGTSIGGFTTQTTLMELELRADTAQMLADHPALTRIPIRLNRATLVTANAPILAQTFDTLGLGVSRVGDLPVATAIAATPGIGGLTVADIGNTTMVLDCVITACPTGATLSSLQAAGQVQARARLRDVTSSIPSRTLGDIAAVLPADITLNDVLIGLMESQDFPWEAVDLVTSGIQEASPNPSIVTYSVAVTATGGDGPFDGTVDVSLPPGWRLVPGTSSVSPVPALALSEPTRRYSGTATDLGYRLIGFAPGTTYTITFQAIPGFVLGSVAASARATSAGVIGTATPRVITVTEPTDAASDPVSAPVLQSDRLYISYTTSSTDVDLFRFNAPPGKVVSVWLSNYEKDQDLSLYGPPLDAAGAAGAPSNAATRGPAPAAGPLNDEGTSGVDGAATAEPAIERDVPTVAGRTPLATSANADVDVEGASAIGADLIQVNPYQGATSSGPYVLRVRVDDTDAPAACAYTRTGGVAGPAFDLASMPVDLETIVLVHQDRLGDAMGATAASDLITGSLTQLTSASGVRGAIVYLDQAVDYSALDANWCSPAANNDVVRQIGGVIDQIRTARPTLRHVVIVGGDDIVPMARIDDVTRTGNESEYANELLSVNGNTITPLTEALGTKHFLTDDPYGDLDPIAWFNRRLYVPDLAVGRLVETRAEIEATVAAYLDPNGDGSTADTGILTATSTYMTGYDFMADGAVATNAAMNTALTAATGTAPSAGTNISPPAGAVTKTQVLTGVAGGRLIGLFGHFSHDSGLTDAGFRTNSGENFSPTEIATALRPAGAPPTARIVFSMGCHSGLSVADGTSGSGDFAQNVLGTGAVYVAMSSYGYGAQGTIAMNESLMTSFVSQLDGGYVLRDRNAPDTPTNRRYLTVGEAFVTAKQQYFSDRGLYGPYDEKSLEAATFYGLPMLRIGQQGAVRTAPAPEAPVPAGGAADYAVVDASQTFAPNAVVTSGGTYYAVPGFEPQSTANRPVQPRFDTDVTATDGAGGLLYAKGVIVTDLDTASTTTIDPVVSRPVLDSSTNEPEIDLGDVAFPSLPASITTFTDPLGFVGERDLLQRQKLVIVPGQFLSDDTVGSNGDGTQVLYGAVSTRVTYSDSSDWERPSITASVGTFGGGSASFSVEASDAAGVQRVLVLFRTDAADWTALDLAPNGAQWQGSAPTPGATTFDYLVQVVDVNGNVATSTGKGRGLDPFVAPTIEPANVSASSASSAEGDSGSAARSLSIVLDRPAPGPITVAYSVSAGSAALGTDFAAAAGTATFATGDVSAEVPVTIFGDTTPEAPEAFTITLTGVTGPAQLRSTTGSFSIVDDDAASPPQTLITIGDPADVAEGDSGTQPVLVPVSLSPAAAGPVTLAWRLLTTGTATNNVDTSGPISGSVVVPANAVTASIPLSIVGDTVVESNETVLVLITSTTPGVAVVDSTAVVTIVDDDAEPPSIVDLGAVSVPEGTAGTPTTASVPVSIAPAASGPISVEYTIGPGTAADGSDFTATTGTLEIAPGSTSAEIPMSIVADDTDELDETVIVTLGAVTGTAAVGVDTVDVTVVDDDATPVMSVVPVQVTEGAASTIATFVATIDRPSELGPTVTWTTGVGSATADVDYTAATGTLTFDPGITTATFSVTVLGDAVFEPTETVPVDFSGASAIALASTSTTLTLVDDDPVPGVSLAVGDLSVLEGPTGSRRNNVVVTLSEPRTTATTFTWTTQNGTALSSSDYRAVPPRIATIPAGSTSVRLRVYTRGDRIDESDESFDVVLSAPSPGVTIGDATGLVTILDDDPFPQLSIADASTSEGATGTRDLVFTVTLSAPTGESVSVGWTTVDDTAKTSNNDYRRSAGTLVFPAGQTSKTIVVKVRGDAVAEPSETLRVRLAGPTRATLSRSEAIGTIVNDD